MVNRDSQALLAPDAHRAAAADAAAALGQPCIALVGAVVPVEVIVAAGCCALHVMSRTEDFDVDAAPMEAGHEPETRSLFRQAVDGAFERAAWLVVPSTSDGYRYLYPYLREMRRRGLGDRVPPVVPFDFLYGRSPAVQLHSLHTLRGFVARLERLVGRTIGEAALADAIALTNRVRAQLRRLQRLRQQGSVTGADAHALTRSGAFWPPGAYLDRVSAWLEGIDAQRAGGGHLRLLLVSAVPLDHEQLHRQLEDAGARVIAEDDAWGSRRGAADVDTALPPLEALFEHCQRHTVSPRMLQAEREEWVDQQLRSGAFDGVVFYVPPSDQFFGWRYPSLRARAEAHGLPSLLIREDVLDPAAGNAIRAQAMAFVAALRARAAA